MKMKSRKLLSTLLSVMMVFSLFAAMPMTASAVTGGEMFIGPGHLGDLKIGATGKGWTWTPETCTLTLTSEYTGQRIEIRCNLYDSNGDITTINLVYSGNVEISNPSGTALYCNERLSISGSGGTLTAVGGDSADGSVIGIHASDHLEIGGDAVVSATGGKGTYSYGIYGGGITIGGNAQVTAKAGTATDGNSIGINSGLSNITIKDNAQVTAKAGDCPSTDGRFSIGITSGVGNIMIKDNARVVAYGGDSSSTGGYLSYGIRTYSPGVIGIIGGEVTACGSSYAMTQHRVLDGYGYTVSTDRNGASPITGVSDGSFYILHSHKFAKIETVVTGSAPAAPGNLTATAGPGGITLNWEDNSDNETSFSIGRKEFGGIWATLVELPADTTTYLDETAEAGKTYTYKMVAENSFGTSDFSNEVSASMPSATAAPNIDSADGWARDAIEAAYALGLIPDSLQSNYTTLITRAEYCAIAVRLYELYTGGPITTFSDFSDTGDINVRKLAGVGVVQGNGDGTFSPNGAFTREQMAAISVNLVETMTGVGIPASNPNFNDMDQAQTWFRPYIGQVQAAGIMQGVGDNRFDPKSELDRQSAIMLTLNLYHFLPDSYVVD
jgi:hypothetical protein